MNKKLLCISGRIFCLWLFCINTYAQGDTWNNALKRLEYLNPGLKADLGVGLWGNPLPVDFDRDGDADLLVVCTDVPFNGIWFFENPGGGTHPVFKAPVKIGPAKKNLQVSYVNNTPKLLGPYVEYKNFFDSPTFIEDSIYTNTAFDSAFTKIRADQWKYLDYDNDGDPDIIVGRGEWGDYGWDNKFDKTGTWTNGPLHGYVYLITNTGNNGWSPPRRLQAGGSDIDVYGMPSPNFADFDGDGDLDLICGDFIDRFTWFENTGTRTKPSYAKGRFLENEQGKIIMDLEMMTPTATDWNKDGHMDLIVGDEDGRVALIENTGKVANGMPQFKSPVYFEQEAQYVKFGALATPFSVDWDNDGDEDLICGNSAGYIGFIENMDGGDPPRWNKPRLLRADGEVIRVMAGENGSIQGPCERKWGYTTLTVADWDGDGLKDIIINSIWGRVEWFKRIESNGVTELKKMGGVKVDWAGAKVPKPAWNWWNPGKNELATQWRTTPFAVDWNKDGLMDLVMLDHEGYLAYYERFRKNGELYLNPGKHIFADAATGGKLQLNRKIAGGSGRRKITFVDWDADGDLDLIVNSDNTALYENTGEQNGVVAFTDKGDLFTEKLAGHTTSPTIVRWGKDGKPRLLIGAEDGHFYYSNAK